MKETACVFVITVNTYVYYFVPSTWQVSLTSSYWTHVYTVCHCLWNWALISVLFSQSHSDCCVCIEGLVVATVFAACDCMHEGGVTVNNLEKDLCVTLTYWFTCNTVRNTASCKNVLPLIDDSPLFIPFLSLFLPSSPFFPSISLLSRSPSSHPPLCLFPQPFFFPTQPSPSVSQLPLSVWPLPSLPPSIFLSHLLPLSLDSSRHFLTFFHLYFTLHLPLLFFLPSWSL